MALVMRVDGGRGAEEVDGVGVGVSVG